MNCKILLSVLCLFYVSSLILMSAVNYTPAQETAIVLQIIVELFTIPIILAVVAQAVIYGILCFRKGKGRRSGFLAPLIINLISLLIMIVATLAGI